MNIPEQQMTKEIIAVYLQSIKENTPENAADLVDNLTHRERVELRVKLEAMGCKQLVKNLFYDYKKQCWID